MEANRRTRADCTVRTLATVASIPYDHADTIATIAGRKAGRGFHSYKLIEAAKLAGFEFRKVRMRPRTLARFLREHPVGLFYVRKAHHAFAVLNGAATHSRMQCRVLDAWEFIPKAPS